jgi:hypothetical protein
MEDAQSLGSSLSNSTNSNIYPLCYKIKDTCLPCDSKGSEKNTCALELINYMKDKKNQMYNPNIDSKSNDKLFECLKQYGDIYKKLGIELYINEKTKQAVFPTNEGIRANLNLYLSNTETNKVSKESIEETMMLYDVLLNDKLREKYNEFYYSNGFGDLDSLKPKEYGIARILGGKRRRTNKRKTNKRKTNKRKTNKRKTNKRRTNKSM